LIKVNYTQGKETPLNIDLGINNKRQDYKIGTMVGAGIVVGRMVNEVD
jgi:hypothetical protein